MTLPESFGSSSHALAFAKDTPFGQSYELIRELGRGGMAIVYLVRERATGTERAVKVIHTKFLGDQEAVARFDRESRLVARLKHPNIVATHSVQWIDGIGLGLVMDHVQGRTLKQILKDGPPLSFEQATSTLNDIASALGYAHERGIVHRDIKPENIFIDEITGRAVLADFGIARSTQGETQLTMAGVAIGTPTYMAPEQIDGSEIDARSDLYSLGLVGWEMVTGRRPWDGETLYNVIYHQKHDELAAIDALRPDTPPRLVYAIEGLLEKSPATRWQSAAQFQAELASTEPPVRRTRKEAPAPDETIAIPVPTPVRRRSLLRRFGAPLAIITVIAAVLLFVWPSPVVGPLVRGRVAAALPTAASVIATQPAPVVPDSIATVSGAMGNSADSLGAGGVSGSDTTVRSPDSGAALLSLPPAVTKPVARSGTFAGGDTALTHGAKTPGRRVGAAARTPDGVPAKTAAKSPAASSSASDQSSSRAAVPTVAPVIPQSSPPSAAPVSIALASYTLSAGGAHTCLIAASGAAYCWGANNDGQLGTGTSQTVAKPTAVSGSAHFASIAAGLTHTCARTSGGMVFCWGDNSHGQLGDGSRDPHSVPARVTFGRPMSLVASGSGFSCGLTSGGDAYCWGSGSRGQIGDGDDSDKLTPTRVSGREGFGALAVGWNHVCGLTDDGAAYCWGSNDAGQLGDGTTSDRSVPTAVRTDLRFTAISAGSGHTCGTTAAGAIYCWGDNKFGQLGDGTRATHLTPVAVGVDDRFIAISAGSVHTCALTQSHEAWCWGRNTYGQLGDGTAVSRTSPVKVSGGHCFVSVKAFGSHTCGMSVSGDLFCCGYNLDGQLGDGTREHRLRPTYIERPTP
jgi:serine/threonine protein kinase/alpha-tubulin suppressor-like RCC1 family protein